MDLWVNLPESSLVILRGALCRKLLRNNNYQSGHQMHRVIVLGAGAEEGRRKLSSEQFNLAPEMTFPLQERSRLKLGSCCGATELTTCLMTCDRLEDDGAYLWRRTAMASALDVATAVVGELDPVRWLVQKYRSLQIQ